MILSKCQVLAPIYREMNNKEKMIIAHNLSMLSDIPAALIGPIGKNSLIKDLQLELSMKTSREISITLLEDQYFQSISGYNALLMSKEFYECFTDYEYILICQHDALILKNTLAAWLNSGYGFVGAPHFVGSANPKQPLKFRKSQNGGLSLRRIPDVLRVFESGKLTNRGAVLWMMEMSGVLAARNSIFSKVLKTIVSVPKNKNEDGFWSEVVPKWFNWYHVPPPEEAALFAFEVYPHHLYETTNHQLPFGCHAFEKYDPEFWRLHLPKNLVPLIT